MYDNRVELQIVCPNVGARQAGDRSPEGSAGSGSGQQETALKGCWQKGPGPCTYGHGEVPPHGPPAGNVSHPVSVTHHDSPSLKPRSTQHVMSEEMWWANGAAVYQSNHINEMLMLSHPGQIINPLSDANAIRFVKHASSCMLYAPPSFEAAQMSIADISSRFEVALSSSCNSFATQANQLAAYDAPDV